MIIQSNAIIILWFSICKKTSRVSRWRYNLSEYKYKIIYVKGSKNVKADALSKAEIVSVESETTLFNDLIEAQNKDCDVQRLIASKNYFIENRVLFKKNDERGRLVIQTSMKKTILNLCHNDMSGGHLGFKKTWLKIKCRYSWKHMYRDKKDG